MEYHIDINAEQDAIAETVHGAKSGDTICCQRDSQFEICKRALLEARLAGVTICLLDQDGYVIRQTSSKKRTQISGPRFSDRQLAVIKALEKVLAHCKKEGITLIGYSDELVALPATLVGTDLASVHAREVYASGAYRGADGIDSLLEQ
jgi:hypothetical protein